MTTWSSVTALAFSTYPRATLRMVSMNSWSGCWSCPYHGPPVISLPGSSVASM